MTLLEVKNLKKVYTIRNSKQQVKALSNVTFSIEEGEYVAIMGESGSGKTTLLNILAALDKPTSGEVLLDGEDLTQIKDKKLSQFRRENLGFVFQDFNLIDTFSNSDNILLPLVLSKESYPYMNQKIQELAPKLGIENILKQYPYEISGGQKQRIAVARALINRPRLLLADEPTGALDSASSSQLLDIFNQMNQEGQTILMVTHSVQAASYAKRVMFIKEGTIFHQIYKGSQTRVQMYQSISDALTLLAGRKDV
ncbi:MAG: ABC transporter ATP-binding protein [Erysipelotrichaceae bacterium]|nr:ABC transporter ATP-binding protein [Erysipelotrichaceae bacterium]